MAIGDDAQEEGYGVVPDTGENGRVRWGAREINRTRDYIAQLKRTIPSVPTVLPLARGGTGGTSRDSAKQSLGITRGTGGPPSGGSNGDIYFRLL